MDDLTRFISNGLALDAKEIIHEAAALREEELADLNVERMNKGLLNNGKKIEPKYSDDYKAFKGFSTPNLKLEGDFQSGVFVDVQSTDIKIGSTDYKEDKLVEKYSENIFGVTTKGFEETIDGDIPDIIDNKLMKGL